MTRALVVEGGGMRGAYAAGVLVGLQRRGEAFDAVYASSSGACSAAYLASGQEEGLRIWQDHLHGARLVRPHNLPFGRPILDLEYLVDEVFARRVPLDVEALRRSPTPLWVTLTSARDGRVEYRDLRRASNPLRVLKATAALPIAYARPVACEGEPWLDGGIGDPVPVARALADGATDLTVVLTKPPGFVRREAPAWISRLATAPYPGARRAFETVPERYNAAMRLVEAPPPGLKMRVIRPPASLRLKRLTTRRSRLLRAVIQGQRDAASA